MVAPQLSAGVYAVDLAVGHIGTSVPLLLAWLLVDRAGRRWWVPPLIAVILAWALVADPIVEIAGIAPLALVAGARFASQLPRRGPDTRDATLACAAVAAYPLAWVAQAVLRALGGYVVSPLPVHVRTLAELPGAAPALWRVLDLFGADFHGMRPGVPLVLAVAHLVSVVLVIAALGRCLRRGVSLVDQVLAVGIVLNLALYLGTMASTEGAHEIAIVLPYAAALAGRMLAPSLLGGTAIRVKGRCQGRSRRADTGGRPRRGRRPGALRLPGRPRLRADLSQLAARELAARLLAGRARFPVRPGLLLAGEQRDRRHR